MIRKAILSLIFLLLFSSTFLFSQNLLDYIPSDATMVIGVKPSSVNAKVDIQALKQLDFFQDMIGEMSKGFNEEASGVINDAIHNPAQYGMDFNADSYFFMRTSEEGSFFSYLFQLSDAAVFSDFFKTNVMNAEKGLSVQSADEMTRIYMQDGSISWNGKLAILTMADVKRKYDEFDFGAWEDYEEEPYEAEEYPEEPYEEEDYEEEIEEAIPPVEEEIVDEEIIEEEWDWEGEESEMGGGETDEEYSARKAAAIDQFTKRLFHIPSDSTISSKTSFTKHIGKRNDVSMWLDYAFLQQMGLEDMPGMDPTMMSFLNAYQSLYSDSYLSMTMNFDPGKIEIDSDAYMSPDWMNYLRKSVDAKVNRKFRKYLKGENLLGYMFFNYNMENVLREGKNMLIPLFESVPMVGPMAEDAMGILDIFIDEEAIYEFFKGDFCLAFTGMREFENMVTTYDYDEDFNRTEKQELKKQTLPEFVLMMSYGNEENLQKFFRLGEKAGGLEKKGLYYEVPASAGIGMNMYAAHHKGILFFTNDTDLVSSKMNSGWSSKKRIEKKHRKLMKENAQVLFWDIPKSLNSASQLGIPFGLSGDQIVNVSKQSLESVLITAPNKVGSSYHSDMSFRFANQQMNSLEQLFNFLNEVYLTQKGGTSM